jgi:hypothetical protein
MSSTFKKDDLVTHPAYPGEVGIVTDYTPARPGLYATVEADFSTVYGVRRKAHEFTLVGANACDCGALKAKTTHQFWCTAHESGGTAPYVQPKERMF